MQHSFEALRISEKSEVLQKHSIQVPEHPEHFRVWQEHIFPVLHSQKVRVQQAYHVCRVPHLQRFLRTASHKGKQSLAWPRDFLPLSPRVQSCSSVSIAKGSSTSLPAVSGSLPLTHPAAHWHATASSGFVQLLCGLVQAN